MKPKADIYQRITDQIIAELETGAAPWLKPWSSAKAGKAVGPGLRPRNAISGRPYSGINVILLWGHLDAVGAYGTAPPLFLTYKQAQDAGGQVRKGEHGCPVIAFRKSEKTEENDAGEKTVKHYWQAFGHTVFHISQVDNFTAPDLAKLHDAKGLEDGSWQAFVDAIGVDLRHGGDSAHYAPIADYVQLPTASAFRCEEHYKATALHEFTHWSGHKSRLSRDLSGRFGSTSYAFEELVAELGAAFLCADHGVVHTELRHAGYIATWIKVLKEDKRAIVKAASLAGKAAEYIGELGRRQVPTCRALVPYKPQLPAVIYALAA